MHGFYFNLSQMKEETLHIQNYAFKMFFIALLVTTEYMVKVHSYRLENSSQQSFMPLITNSLLPV